MFLQGGNSHSTSLLLSVFHHGGPGIPPPHLRLFGLPRSGHAGPSAPEDHRHDGTGLAAVRSARFLLQLHPQHGPGPDRQRESVAREHARVVGAVAAAARQFRRTTGGLPWSVRVQHRGSGGRLLAAASPRRFADAAGERGGPAVSVGPFTRASSCPTARRNEHTRIRGTHRAGGRPGGGGRGNRPPWTEASFPTP